MEVENFGRAYQHSDHVRSHIDPQSAQLYEYLLLTYLQKETPDRIALDAVDDISVAEGRELLRLHRSRERNRGLVARKKRRVLTKTGRLECEACGFDFAAVYGELGAGFAECHHTQPLAQGAGERRTALTDLAVVCANCHRMLHRRPWRTVSELSQLLRSLRAGNSVEPNAGAIRRI